jgi:uncharacterized protein YbbC (DUF1343 family)
MRQAKIFPAFVLMFIAGALSTACPASRPESTVPPDAQLSSLAARASVHPGAEVLLDKHLDLIRGKRIGLITNHTAILPDGRHILDVLRSTPGVSITALFSPEHGLAGTEPDGTKVGHDQGAPSGLRVFSLFGETTKPTPEMLEGIDVLVFDIQDIGVRYYTYTSTLFLSLEAAAENGIPYLVLDRPNPIGGLRVEGPILESAQKSFVGLLPLPIIHGMTVGELARLANGEGWLKDGVKADLRVIPAEGWTRDLWFDQTGLPWIKPSPSMMTIRTAAVYPATCFLEGTNVSEGRGTKIPFESIGAPFIDGAKLAADMNGAGLPGVVFRPAKFTPEDIAMVTSDPKYEGIACEGVFLDVTDRKAFKPVETGVHLLAALKRLYPKEFRWRSPSRSTGAYYLDLLAGTPRIREGLDAGIRPEAIVASAEAGLNRFFSLREKYLLY